MLPEAAAEQYRAQQSIAAVTVASMNRLWSRMGEDFDTSWSNIREQTTSVAETGRAASVTAALPYTEAVLAETGLQAPASGRLDGSRFLQSAPDGRSVVGLLDQAPIKAKLAVAGGAGTASALASAGSWLSTTALTLMADTRREVYAADIIQRPAVAGYVRMLNPPSCSRCIILAGKWFQWNTGFQRHPRCDCLHIPAAENTSGDMRTDPYATFKGMSTEQQEKVFGRINARAIRDGADIYRVVNIEQRGLATAKAAKVYGTPSRMTVDDIYRRAGTRTNAIRMMREEGYILDRGQVAAPLSPGVRTREQILAAGRGRGVVTIEGRRVTTGRAARFDAAQSGVRDPLNRSTMTAAERRLYDANYRLDYALRTGRIPQSIGVNSARRGTVERVAAPDDIAEYRRALARQLSVASDPKSPESLRRVARALGLI